MKNYISLCVLAVLVLVSFLSSQKSFSASELSIQTTTVDNTVRFDYIDSKGRITFAEDKKYATCIKTYDGEDIILEEYFDESGKPTTISNGYSKIRREYENGRNLIINFLDDNNQPVLNNNGYDSVKTLYNDDEQASIDTYYAGQIQVKHKHGYWQYKRIIRNGTVSEIRYLDKDSKPVCSIYGYAIIRRSYSDAGTTDMYFDADDRPTTSTLGQYGVLKSGESHTYLDSRGNPMNISRGYSTVKVTGNKTEFFDAEGHPVAINRKQYGTLTINN